MLTVEVPGSTANFATAATGSSEQERQYLVAGGNEWLPNPAAITAAGGTWVGQIASIGVAVVRSSNPEFLTLVKQDRSVALASPDPEVELREPDTDVELDPTVVAELTSTETQAAGDPLYHLQWPHRAMGVTEAHAHGIKGEGVRVAVVDSGIDCLHEDLRDRCVPEHNEHKSFVRLADGSGFEDPWDATNPHGTLMAGIIAATCDNGKGVCGVAPAASLISVKVFPASGERFPWSQLLQGYDWASGVGRADIINGSQVNRIEGTEPEGEQVNDLLGIANRMMALIYQRGAVLFAASGNDRPPLNVALLTDLKVWPADNAPRVVTVGATGPCGAALNGNVLDDYYDNAATQSNYGFDQYENRFVVSPGGETTCNQRMPCQVGSLRLNCPAFDQIPTTAPPSFPNINGYSVSAGTSSATANASGLAALILSRYPDMKPGQLTDTILETATDLGAPGYDPIFGYGRLSASWLE
jgi:subtilisin family serine protease